MVQYTLRCISEGFCSCGKCGLPVSTTLDPCSCRSCQVIRPIPLNLALIGPVKGPVWAQERFSVAGRAGG